MNPSSPKNAELESYGNDFWTAYFFLILLMSGNSYLAQDPGSHLGLWALIIYVTIFFFVDSINNVRQFSYSVGKMPINIFVLAALTVLHVSISLCSQKYQRIIRSL